MENPVTSRSNRFPSSTFPTGFACLLLIAMLAGCNRGMYRASSLPPELSAPPVINMDAFRLSQLGTPVDQGDLIQPGDTLQVRLNAGDEEDAPGDWDVTVTEDGSISVPFIGTLRVAGLSLAAAAAAIRETSIRRGIYVDPVVSVTFQERKVNHITVTGAVRNPGTIELRSGASTLVAALVAAGGLSDSASPIVEIQNPRRVDPPGTRAGRAMQATYHASDGRDESGFTPGLVRLNLLNPSATGDSAVSAANQYLQDGAVVSVLERPARYITVIGLTGNRTMPLPSDRPMRLLDALANAGGPRHSIWIADKVKVIRQVPGSDRTVTITASIRKAKRDSAENLVLAPGDIISVEENAITFTIDTIGSLLGVGVTAARIGLGAY